MENMNPSFYCPITGELMIDPVVDSEGNTYERSAIELWIEGHHTSPITRNIITRYDLRPNRSLKNAIEEILASGREILPRIADHINLKVAATISVPELSLTVTTKKLRQEWLDATCPTG
jgi:U-box domain